MDSKLAAVEAQREGPKLFKYAIMFINKANDKGKFSQYNKELNIRPSDLLFLTFHKENPSPSGATVILLLQQVSYFMIHSGSAKNVHPFCAAKVPFLKDFLDKGKPNSLSLVSLGLNCLL